MIISRKRRRVEVEVETVSAKEDLFKDYESKPSTKKLKMAIGSSYLPKLDELKPRGEDANFVMAYKNTIGVADGVGGWARKGIDSGIYARQLMSNCVLSLLHERIGSVQPKRVLREAYRKTTAQGSSTACILTLRKDNIIHAANVGDSGFMIFRENQFVYQSLTKQHGFNYPYQLGNHPKNDGPESADEMVISSVECGDVIVVGTDGLLDNIHPCEIVEVLEESSEGGFLPEETAIKIAQIALENSLDENYLSSFMIAAEAAGVNLVGGKYDDITVVVAKIELPKDDD